MCSRTSTACCLIIYSEIFRVIGLSRCMEKKVGELTDKIGNVTKKVGVFTGNLHLTRFKSFALQLSFLSSEFF